MKILRRLNQFKAPRDLWLLLRVAALAAVLPILLRCVKLPRLLKVLESRNASATIETERIDKTVRFIGFVLSSCRLGYKNRCLKSSLLLYHFLGEAGLPVEINFGIQKADGLSGHAWISGGGDAYRCDESCTSEYEVIYSSVGAK